MFKKRVICQKCKNRIEIMPNQIEIVCTFYTEDLFCAEYRTKV